MGEHMRPCAPARRPDTANALSVALELTEEDDMLAPMMLRINAGIATAEFSTVVTEEASEA